MQNDGRLLLYEALAKAQGAMQNASLNKVNPHFKSKYADLAAIRDATVPALSANGLAIIQYTEFDNGQLILKTRLVHASGQYIESCYPIMAPLGDHHKMGSAMTYAKRYSWAAVCAISADEDDDGNAAQGKDNKPKSNQAFGGPLTKTDLKAKMRAFAGDLAACGDSEELAGCLLGYKEVLEQCERDLPEWFQNEDGNGASQAIAAKKIELSERTTA